MTERDRLKSRVAELEEALSLGDSQAEAVESKAKEDGSSADTEEMQALCRSLSAQNEELKVRE